MEQSWKWCDDNWMLNSWINTYLLLYTVGLVIYYKNAHTLLGDGEITLLQKFKIINVCSNNNILLMTWKENYFLKTPKIFLQTYLNWKYLKLCILYRKPIVKLNSSCTKSKYWGNHKRSVNNFVFGPYKCNHQKTTNIKINYFFLKAIHKWAHLLISYFIIINPENIK